MKMNFTKENVCYGVATTALALGAAASVHLAVSSEAASASEPLPVIETPSNTILTGEDANPHDMSLMNPAEVSSTNGMTFEDFEKNFAVGSLALAFVAGGAGMYMQESRRDTQAVTQLQPQI